MIVYSKVETAPESYPVTLEETKLWLRVDGEDEDTLIQSLIQTATRVCESYAGLSFMPQTRVVKLDNFGKKDVLLPYGPVTSVTSVVYKDDDDADQTIDAADYLIDTQSGLSKIRVSESWPYTNRSLNNVVITYEAGYTDANAVPYVVKEAILRRVSYMYQNRGDGRVQEDTTWMDLLDTIKVYWDAEY